MKKAVTKGLVAVKGGYSKLSPETRSTVNKVGWGVGTTLGLIAVWKIRKAIKNRKGDKNDSSNIKPRLDLLEDAARVTKNRRTITELQARTYADSAFRAMNPNGTREADLAEVFKRNHTDGDLYLIMKEFGIRPYNGFGRSKWGDKVLGFSDDLNLIDWIKAELHPVRDKKYYDIIKNCFNNANVPF